MSHAATAFSANSVTISRTARDKIFEKAKGEAFARPDKFFVDIITNTPDNSTS
jgi:hypothetical protein